MLCNFLTYMLTRYKMIKSVLIIFTLAVLLQTQTSAFTHKIDSLIKFHGYVLDTISDAPNQLPVKAKIVLERLPYGSEIGIISSKDTTGYFEYFLSFEHDYKIEIKSEGHHTLTETIKTRQWAIRGELNKNYYLRPEWKQDQVIRLNKLIFEQGLSIISRESLNELNTLAKALNDNPSMVIQLEGQTDWRGDHKSNLALSEERVAAVRNYLVSLGINAKRIKTKAFGGDNPITRDDSMEASAINRRVEVRILKID